MTRSLCNICFKLSSFLFKKNAEAITTHGMTVKFTVQIKVPDFSLRLGRGYLCTEKYSLSLLRTDRVGTGNALDLDLDISILDLISKKI